MADVESGEVQVDQPETGVNPIGGVEVSAKGGMAAILELGVGLSRQLGRPITLNVDSGNDDPGWERVAALTTAESPDDKPPLPGPVSLIGGMAIDAQTGASSFSVSAIRFDMGSAAGFDVPAHDVATVFTRAAAGNSHALEAVRALGARNSEAFGTNLRALKDERGHEAVARAAVTKDLPK